MASEEDSAESSTSSPAASTSQVSRAARQGASENLRCPICRAATDDRASLSWRRHPFCFYCMVEWFHKRVDSLTCQSPFPQTFHMVGDSNSEVHSIEESISSASHTRGDRAGSSPVEGRQHHSSGHQRRTSHSRSCGGSRGGSRGRPQKKYPRRHHQGRARAQSYSHSSSRRRRQSRAQNTARDKGQAPRSKRRVRTLSRRPKRRQQDYQVSFIEPRAKKRRSRQRSRSSARQTLKEYLREMERDEGRALRHDWYLRASSGRSRRQQQRRRVSYREPQATRSRTPRRFRSTLPLKENPRRMECYESQPLRRTEQGIHPSPRRSERLQQGRQVSFMEPRVTRSQSQGRSHSTQHQTLQENLRMEHDDGQAPRPEGDIPISSGCSECCQQEQQIPFTEP